MKKALMINTVIFSICFIYAIVRYNVYGGIMYNQIPVFTINKAFAFTAMFAACLSVFWKSISSDLIVRKYLGLQGFFLAVFHAILSLAILRPEYYLIMFDHSTTSNGYVLNLWGNLTVLMGVSTLMTFALAAFYSISGELKHISAMVFLSLLFLAAHIAMKGFHSWPVRKWIAYLIPISLVSFAVVAFTIVYKVIYPKKR